MENIPRDLTASGDGSAPSIGVIGVGDPLCAGNIA
ncbi:LOW QUALITY PROTEIN: hypothetical protein PanWU01x14_272130 [Parasponia andersonii]|uniref:Uncharacterized protein n=1 Tax=Parasponia andersonii TaxID=3476 RepID=A0A2P5B4E5_PARAD|nr:LOW QUALITY PROTEIN: hypothetical protein PanWU01x14_272130 [Parasponia andersonii]